MAWWRAAGGRLRIGPVMRPWPWGQANRGAPAAIARKLTPLRQAPKTMGKMIIGIDESTLFWVAAAGMAVVLVVALWRRRLPADPLPFLS